MKMKVSFENIIRLQRTINGKPIRKGKHSVSVPTRTVHRKIEDRFRHTNVNWMIEEGRKEAARFREKVTRRMREEEKGK